MRENHGRDESLYDPVLPDAVAYAKSVEDFSAVLTLDSWSHLEIGAKMLLSVVGILRAKRRPICHAHVDRR